MSDDPLTDKDAAAIEQWAYTTESRVRLRVRRLLRDLEATRADLAAETATRGLLRAQERRIADTLMAAGVPVGDLVDGVGALVAERDAAYAIGRGESAKLLAAANRERDDMRSARDVLLAEVDRLRALVGEACDGWADQAAMPTDGPERVRKAAGL